MTTPSKRKGDRAELEVAALLTGLLGIPVRRKLGAGRTDDCGDLDGLDDWTIEVKNRPGDIVRALREGLDDAAREQANAGTTFGVALVRRPGGRWVAAMSLEQFATVVRELLPDDGAVEVPDDVRCSGCGRPYSPGRECRIGGECFR
jgi:hypothetical protein